MKKKYIKSFIKLFQSPFTVLAVGLLIFLSLFLETTANKDISWVPSSLVAYPLLKVFGFAAWGIPSLLLYISVQQIRKKKISNALQFRLVAAILSLAGILGLISSGGIIGGAIGDFAKLLFGTTVSLVFLIVGFIAFISPDKSWMLIKLIRDYAFDFINLTAKKLIKIPEQLRSKLKEMGPDDPQNSFKERDSFSSDPSDHEGKKINPPLSGNNSDYELNGGMPLPSIECLQDPAQHEHSGEEIQILRDRLTSALGQQKITAHIDKTFVGPTVATFFLGTKSNSKLSDIEESLAEISRQIGGFSDYLRVNTNIDSMTGKIGIEVPLQTRRKIFLRELLTAKSNARSFVLPLHLGISSDGGASLSDLTTMPHLMIAGESNSGKSTALKSIATSLLMQASPKRLQLRLIDTKLETFSDFHGLPHLDHGIITDSKEALESLQSAIELMDERHRLLKENSCKDLKELNANRGEPEFVPYYAIFIDELADLFMQHGEIAEEKIVKLVQKSRNTGIHLVISTQRTTPDVMTGLIRTHVAARLAFKVSSKVDSRIILNRNGAETLTGKGDGLFLNPSNNRIVRLQTPIVSSAEIERVKAFWKNQ